MFRITLIILSLLLFSQLFIKQHISVFVCYFYLIINLFTFIIYSIDKSAAIHHRWRVKEFYLHALSLAGGWWGALVAQQFIRHKSIKRPFLMVFSLTLLTHFLLVTWIIHKGILS